MEKNNLWISKIKNSNNIFVKYSKSSLFIIEFLFGIVGILMSVIAFKFRDIESIINALLWIILCVVIYFIFKTYWVKVEEGLLTYNSFLGRKKIIKLEDIEKAWIEVGVYDVYDLFKPMIRLVVKPKRHIEMKPFYIHMKVLEKINGVRLMNILPIEKKSKIVASDYSIFKNRF